MVIFFKFLRVVGKAVGNRADIDFSAMLSRTARSIETPCFIALAYLLWRTCFVALMRARSAIFSHL
jgi:hypothetical protein